MAPELERGEKSPLPAAKRGDPPPEDGEREGEIGTRRRRIIVELWLHRSGIAIVCLVSIRMPIGGDPDGM